MEEESPPTEVTIIVPQENENVETVNVEIDSASNEENTDTAAASDAVEIARIQSERDITITAINAETEQTRQETYISQLENENRDLKEWRAQMEERLNRMENLLTPQTPSEEIAEQIAEEVATEVTEELQTPTEQNLTEISTSIPTAETPTEVSESVEEESEEVEPVSQRRKYIAI